jgi:hypothetical protein
MITKYRIGLKYCGGCNPHYDRVQAVSYLRERLKDRIELVSYEDPDIEGVLVIAGCPTACVDLSPFRGRPVWVVTSRQQVEDFLERVQALDPAEGLEAVSEIHRSGLTG